MARIVVVGAGFTGLSAALRLARAGHSIVVLEADEHVGGLGGGFEFGDVTLEKFYHHWFMSDTHILNLVRELGSEDRIVTRPSRTGMYYNRSVFRLSTPLDLLKFTPLPLHDRIRLGLFSLYAQSIRNWRALEDIPASKWLIRGCGERAYNIVWRPLLESKFSRYSEQLSATWFWKKLQLRGGSRGGGGQEMLAYYRGGFAALAESLRTAIEEAGGQVLTGAPATRILADRGSVTGVETTAGVFPADHVIATPALPVIADLMRDIAPDTYIEQLLRIRYLSNVCLVLALDRSLSSTYWMNVNDASFPFVGVIEHTNFEPPSEYGGRHIVYLSRYLHHEDPLYGMDAEALLHYAAPHIRRMFPEFSEQWIVERHLWKARYAQPVAELGYSRLIPAEETPVRNPRICTMAQNYPEDRGTNYAVREDEAVAARIIAAV